MRTGSNGKYVEMDHRATTHMANTAQDTATAKGQRVIAKAQRVTAKTTKVAVRERRETAREQKVAEREQKVDICSRHDKKTCCKRGGDMEGYTTDERLSRGADAVERAALGAQASNRRRRAGCT
jgi:hypothetical protein